MVDHYRDEQTLVVEYADGSATTYPLGDVEEINPER